MKWMPISLRSSSRFSTRSALPHIRLASFSLLVLAGLSVFCSPARADFTQADSSNLQSILLLQQEIQAVIGAQAEGNKSIKVRLGDLNATADDIATDAHDIATDTHSIDGNVADIESLIRNINGYLTGTDQQGLRSKLDSLIDYQRRLYDLLATNQFSSSSSSFVPSDLNPWWATNSAFVTSKDYYSYAYPDESPDYVHAFSFLQFMSLWGAKLNQPGNFTDAQTRANWSRWWGVDSLSRWWTDRQGRRPNYTWFDWVTDAFRSNWVLHASLAHDISSNATEDANSINNTLGSFEESLGVLLSNALLTASPENPWWATNSVFVASWNAWDATAPWPKNAMNGAGLTFPQAFSLFLSDLHSREGTNDWFRQWGSSGQNATRFQYTWFDWIADAIKSNMVLHASLLGPSSGSSVSSVIGESPVAYGLHDDIDDQDDADSANFSSQVSYTQDQMEDAVDYEEEHSLSIIQQESPYEEIRIGFIQRGIDTVSDAKPDFDETGDPVIVLFDGQSGLPMDAAGAVRVNLSEVLSNYSGMIGNIFTWLWRVVNASLTIILLFHCLEKISSRI